MKDIKVSKRVALAILATCGGLPLPKRDNPVLLPTGAKLYYSKRDSRYYVGGYAWDGSDVDSIICPLCQYVGEGNHELHCPRRHEDGAYLPNVERIWVGEMEEHEFHG